MAQASPFTEEQMSALVQSVTPLIRREVSAEVSLQLRGVNARLGAIEVQAAANGDQTTNARIEVAGVATMLTMMFGTDGLGGTLGILIRNAATDAKRANDLAHKTFGHLDVLVGRGWLQKEIGDEQMQALAKVEQHEEKKADKRSNLVRWIVGLGVSGGIAAAFKDWLTKHWH